LAASWSGEFLLPVFLECTEAMDNKDYRVALVESVAAARAVGVLLRRNLHKPKKADSETLHDIKLQLDVRSQALMEGRLRKRFPAVAVMGEEGNRGMSDASERWVIDPIDGTVNYAYGIPHACVSIALQSRRDHDYETMLGVVYDPFVDECWTAMRGGSARLNGRVIRVSDHSRWNKAIVTFGFAKSRDSLDRMLPLFQQLVHQVRKIRIMGSAALALVYVATGRMDAYFEPGVRLWDIAAGGLILECAGGAFGHELLEDKQGYRVMAHNGQMGGAIRRMQRKAQRSGI
jgi:myo-inositol-1(or 4)-monophosphatase